MNLCKSLSKTIGLHKSLSVLFILCLLSISFMNISAATLKYNGGTYTGVVKNGKMNGTGTYIDKNGVIYIGTFKNNVLTGNGTMIDGNKYVGNFTNGKLNGKVDIYFQDGNILRGEPYKNGKPINDEPVGEIDSSAVEELEYVVNSKTYMTYEFISDIADRAIKINSQYYLAYYYKAKSYADSATTRWSTYVDRGMKAADSAIKINTDRPEAYFLKGVLYFYGYEDYDKADEYFQKALDRKENCGIDENGNNIIDLDFYNGDYVDSVFRDREKPTVIAPDGEEAVPFEDDGNW